MTTPFPFTTGQVLTAAQMNAITTLPINDQTASYTLVVGDVGKRVVMNVASANTVTVNNSIFGAGDTINIVNKGAGVSTVTAGAGVTINTSDSLALAQYQSGSLVALSASSFLFFPTTESAPASALTFISETAIGSGVSSVTVSNCFSSTYDDYLILIRDYTNSVGDTGYNGWRLGASGQTTHNSYGFYGQVNAESLTSAAYCRLGVRKTTENAAIITLMSPNLATNTWGTSIGPALQFPGYYNVYISGTTQYTDFTLIPTADTISGGTIRIYGYAKA